MINKNKYYKCRDGSLYQTHTKEEIDNLIDLNNFSTWFPYLKDMDYPVVPEIYASYKNFHKYIARMRRASFRDFGWKEDRFCTKNSTYTCEQQIDWNKAANIKKATFTLMEDGKYQAEIITDLTDKNGKLVESIWHFKTNNPYLETTSVFSFNSNSETLWTLTIPGEEEVEHGLDR